jgi:acyl-CoA ligase (AMP-forming) (exosortase A-associated)
MPTLETVIAIDPSQAGKESDFGQLRLIDWQEAMENSSPEAATGSGLIEHDLAAILYTSGSTGRPKGVVLNHLNIVAGAVSVSEYLKITANDRLLSILSFGFDYGLNQLMTAFLCGAQLVLLDHLFSKDIIQAVHKYAITGLAAVAATWNQLLQIPWSEEQIASLRYITNSGGAIPENYVRELRKRMPKVSLFLMYGLTEAFRSTYLDPHLVDEKPTSMGKAIPGAEILVLDDNDRPVKAGEVGQLVHRGPLVAQGYWGEPELTAVRFRRNPLQPSEVLIPEMVVYSGDYVRRDEEGFLYFVGRKDEMIKCAGNRVSPTEVEEVLYTSGTIQDAIVLGIPHEIYGHTIKAIVVPRPGAELVADELIAHCRRMLPPYMIPQNIEIHRELPRNANGKLDRALVKSQVLEKLAQKQQEN